MPGVVNALPLLVAIVLVAVVCLYPLQRTGTVFSTPDETSSYLTARAFSEHGGLYLEDELTRVDREDLLHTRGFITHGGRAVPMQFLGHPLLWGFSLKLLGDRALILVPVLLGLFFTVYCYRLFRLTAPAASPVLFLFLFTASPVVYLLGRPFLSVSLAAVLTVPTFFHAIRYTRTRRATELLLCSAFLSLALLARPDNLLIALPAIFLVVLPTGATLFSRIVLRDLALFSLVFLILFVAPVLLLNQLTYGSPVTFGYHLADQTIGLRAVPAPDLSGGARLLRVARNLVFPFDVSIGAALSGLVKYFVILTPLLTLAALLHAGPLVRILRTPGRRWRAIAGLILAGYLVISRSNDALHGMARLAPDIVDSLARYWMPLYLVLLVAAWKGLARFKRPLVQAMVALLALGLGLHGLFSQWDQSFFALTQRVHIAALTGKGTLHKIEPDAVIYCGRSDKYLVPYRTVAAWWVTGSDNRCDLDLVARSAARVLDLGRPVYVLDAEVEREELRSALGRYGLDLKRTGRMNRLLAVFRPQPPDPHRASN